MTRIGILVLALLVLTGFRQGAAPLIIENRHFRPTAPGQTGLELVFPRSESVADISVIIRNVTFAPGFAHCLVLVNAWNARLENVNCAGAYYGDTQNGIVLAGQSHNVKIARAHIAHAVTGVLIVNESEGTSIVDSTIEGVTHGVFADASDQPFRRPSLWIRDTHIAASRAGVVLANRTQVSLSGNLIYQHVRLHPPGSPFEGLLLRHGTDDVTIRDTVVVCRPGPVGWYPDRSVALTATLPPLIADLHPRVCD